MCVLQTQKWFDYLWSVDLEENPVSPDSSLLILCGLKSVGSGEPLVWSERRSSPGDAENIETSSETKLKKKNELNENGCQGIAMWMLMYGVPKENNMR